MTTPDSSTSQTQTPPVVPDANAPAAPAAAAPAPAAAAPAQVETPAAPAATPVPAAQPAQAAPAAQAPAATPPETYTFKAAQGQTVDPALVAAMTPAFKAAGLTQEKVDGIVEGFQQFQTQLIPQLLARDLEVTMKDPELGQLNWGRTQGMVNEALGAFTTPQFRQKLERWGIANDLEFVRVFASIGAAMRGDSPTRGSPSTASEESMADRMYRKAAKPNNVQ